jgi:hypothetical protein
MKRRGLLAWVAIVAVGLCGLSRAADEAGKAVEAPKFVRLKRTEDNRPAAMQTAVVSYQSPKRPGVEVGLVGAVHIGDKSYYEELNKLFENYDVVLYELVAAEGTRVPKGGRQGPNLHPIGMMQDGMSTILELSHQLNCVDYTKKNFVHADMSPEDFNKSMDQRGESFFQMYLRLMGAGIAQNAAATEGTSDADLLMALFSKDRALTLKRLMAQQFDSLDAAMSVLDGPGGTAILTERNKRCFEVLEKQLDEGKKRIAIFYGAAHLPDMERRLVGDYGFARSGESWLTAWQLQPVKANAANEGAK